MRGKNTEKSRRDNDIRADFNLAIDAKQDYTKVMNDLMRKYYLTHSSLNQIIKKLGTYNDFPNNQKK